MSEIKKGRSLLAYFVENRFGDGIRCLAEYSELDWNVSHQLTITDEQKRIEAEKYLEKMRHAHGPPVLCLGPELCRRCYRF